MDFLDKQIAPPKGWEKFEDLARALFAAVYKNPLAAKNGRRGQPQHSVDVFVEPEDQPGKLFGIQCKGKDQGYGAKATTSEFDAELAKAENFKPALDHWIFVTTAADDEQLQEHARTISRKRRAAGKFPVDALGWGALHALIAQHDSVIREFYPEHVSDMPDHVERLRGASDAALAAIDDGLRHEGTELSLIRPESWTRAKQALFGERIIRLTGDGGSGKSAILKRMAQAHDGPRLILKDNRVSAVTLGEHLGQLGITRDAAPLLDAMAGDGRALCVIDGADRLLTSERRPVVIDLLRAVAACKTAAQWQIVTTARGYQDRDLVADALTEAGWDSAGAQIVIENLLPADLDALGQAFPSFGSLLSRRDLGEQNRSLFLLRELLRRAAPPAGVWSELDIADAWAAGDLAGQAQSAFRARALAQMATALVDTPWRLPGRSEIDAEGLALLIDEGTVMQLPHQDALRLVHDVHEDWLLARHLRGRASEIAAILRAADQPLWWLRAVRLAAQQMLEQHDLTGWQALIEQLDAAEGLDPIWTRAVLAAPLYSERSDSILDGLGPLLLAGEAQPLRRLLDTLIVSETRLDDRMLTLLADRDEATRYAMAAYWRQPVYRSWVPFLRWSLPLWECWPAALIPRLSELAAIFARATAQIPNGQSQALAVIAWRWLVVIEDVRSERNYSNRVEPFGLKLDEHRGWEEIEERLREILVASVASAPSAVRQYLERLAAASGLRDARDKLLQSPGTVPTHLPAQWTEMCLRQFVAPRRRARRDTRFGPELFSYLDGMSGFIRGGSGLSPSSPLRAGFDQLFAAAPDQALRLFHRIERRSSTLWRWHSKCQDRRRPLPIRLRIGDRTITLWGDDPVYRWSRGILGGEVLGSIYMALDDWIENQAAAGVPMRELVERVLQDQGLIATSMPLIAAIGERINDEEAMTSAAPFIAAPRLWEYDIRRQIDERGAPHRIGFWSADNIHFQASEKIHQRHVKRSPLHHALLLPFWLKADPQVRVLLNNAREAWTGDDLAAFEDELADPEQTNARDAQIERYRSDADPAQIRVEQADDGIRVSIAPPEEDIEKIEELGSANRLLNEAFALANWVQASREQKTPAPAIALMDAIERAKALAAGYEESENPDIGFSRTVALSGIVGVAAVAAHHLLDVPLDEHRPWIEQWLLGAAAACDRDEINEDAILVNDYQPHCAWGLAALATRTRDATPYDIWVAKLAVHRLASIAQATIAGLDWSSRPAFVRAIHLAALDACIVDIGWWWFGPKAKQRAKRRSARARAKAALRALGRPRVRAPMLPPPPDRQWVWLGKWPLPLQRRLMPAKRMLDWSKASAVFKVIDWPRLVETEASGALWSAYLTGLADWTRAYSEDTHRHDRQFPYEWGHMLAKTIGRHAFARGGGEAWRALLAFDYHDRPEDLVGEYLDGAATALVESGGPPDDRFWFAWRPAADWLTEHGLPKRRRHHDSVSHGARAAGMVGPYHPPFPPDWRYLEDVMGAIDRWVRAGAHLPSVALAVLPIAERMNEEQRTRWFMSWLELWTAQNGTDESFWSYNGLGNKAAVLLKPLSASPAAVRAQCRAILAILADGGSTASRELIASFAASRRT